MPQSTWQYHYNSDTLAGLKKPLRFQLAVRTSRPQSLLAPVKLRSYFFYLVADNLPWPLPIMGLPCLNKVDLTLHRVELVKQVNAYFVFIEGKKYTPTC